MKDIQNMETNIKQITQKYDLSTIQAYPNTQCTVYLCAFAIEVDQMEANSIWDNIEQITRHQPHQSKDLQVLRCQPRHGHLSK